LDRRRIPNVHKGGSEKAYASEGRRIYREVNETT